MHNLKYLIICVIMGGCSGTERTMEDWHKSVEPTLCIPEIVLCEESLK